MKMEDLNIVKSQMKGLEDEINIGKNGTSYESSKKLTICQI